MDKKIVYIGIALIVIAFVILLIDSFATNINSSFANAVVFKNITLSAHDFSAIELNASASSLIFIIARSGNPINWYLFNNSAYTTWRNATESYACAQVVGIPCTNPNDGLSFATELENKGAFVIYKNQSNVSIPSSTSSSAAPIYATNQSKLYNAGSYYFVADNTNGSASSSRIVNVTIAYLPPINNSSVASGSLAGLSGQLAEAIEVGIAFFIVLVAGLVTLVYGVIRKPKTPDMSKLQPGQKLDANASKDDVDNLYKKVEKKKTNKKSS